MCVLFLREPIGTDISNNWDTSLAMVGLITSRNLTLVGGPLCPEYWHSFEGLPYLPIPWRWRAQKGNVFTSRPALCRMTSYSFRFASDKKQFFRCVVTSSPHSCRNTVSVRPREDPQSRRPYFDKEQASARITWLFLFLRPLTLVSADP